MNYELATAWRIVRQEGVTALVNKFFLYLRQMAAARRFAAARRGLLPAEPEAVIDFSIAACDGLIRPQQVKSEILHLATLVRGKQPRIVVEIGTATGGTLFIWCALAAPEALLVSIDLPAGIHGGGYPAWKTPLYQSFAGPRQRLHLLRRDSHSPDTLRELKALLSGGGIDFLFLDGDHTYEGVKQDYDFYAPLVAPGGVIVFHDICRHPPELDCHVDRFWNEVKQGRRHQEFIKNPAQGSCGIGIIHV
jgi:predicted O-methyltransferase YrrM